VKTILAKPSPKQKVRPDETVRARGCGHAARAAVAIVRTTNEAAVFIEIPCGWPHFITKSRSSSEP